MMKNRQNKHKGISQRMVIIGIGVLAVIIVTIIFFVTQQKQTKPTTAPATLTTYQVKRHELRLSGQVQAVRSQKIDIPEGTVQNLTVKNGDTVAEGQQLLTVYHPDVQQKITTATQSLAKQQRSQKQLDDQINQLKTSLNQLAADDPQKSEIQSQLTEAQNNRQDAAASVDQATQELNQLQQDLNTAVKAPFAGRLYIDYQSNGSQSITETSSDMEAVGEVSEFDYNDVKVGQSATVQALSTKTKQTTAIDFISSDPAKSSKPNLAKYEVTAKLDQGFLNGQSVSIILPLGGLEIPKTAVRQGAVYKVVNGRAVRTKITYTKKDNMYEVTEGLDSGDRILQSPTKSIKNGAKVTVDD
ncbi:efflux RND transporter periplasmic adaptor subunit [Lacticaseibacillus rhamnosus]|uniref:efflux RND transporter periplasmic adaptor subunit n=1 Tax=Lacticaseibacillus rhamnosus TaxID=47715 RepID=UPI003C12BDE1